MPIGRKASKCVVVDFEAKNNGVYFRTQNYKDTRKRPKDANFYWYFKVRGPEGTFEFTLMQNKEGTFHVWYIGGYGTNAKRFMRGRFGTFLDIEGSDQKATMTVEPFDINHSGVFLVTFTTSERPCKRQRLNEPGDVQLKVKKDFLELRNLLLANKFAHIELVRHAKKGLFRTDLGHSWIVVKLHKSQHGGGGLTIGDSVVIELTFSGSVDWQFLEKLKFQSRQPPDQPSSRWIDERTFLAVCGYWDKCIDYNILTWNCHSFSRNLCSIAWPERFDAGDGNLPWCYKDKVCSIQ